MGLAKLHRTAGLVLISGYYMPTTRLDTVLMSPPTIPILGDLTRYTVSPLLGWLMAPALFRQLFSPAPVTEAFKRHNPTSMTLRPWQVRANAADTALMVPGAETLKKRYDALNVPVIILGAPGDKIVDTQQHATSLHRQLRHSQLRLVNGSGHMLHHTAPSQVVAAVEDLIGGDGTTSRNTTSESV